MISKEHQIVIIAYLEAKLGLEEEWYITPQDVFFNRTPNEIVMVGEGDQVIMFLEVRLGLRPGIAF